MGYSVGPYTMAKVRPRVAQLREMKRSRCDLEVLTKRCAVELDGWDDPSRQNARRSANWICRLERCVEVIVPAPPTPTVELGNPNSGWLKPLKNSERNCSSRDSLNRNFFAIEKSTLYRFGAFSEFRPNVPQVKAGPEAKAAGLNHWLMFWLDGIGLTPGTGLARLAAPVFEGEPGTVIV